MTKILNYKIFQKSTLFKKNFTIRHCYYKRGSNKLKAPDNVYMYVTFNY